MSVIDRSAKAEESSGKGLALPARRVKSGPSAPLAAPPRARLLPPEVGRRKRDRALRGRVWAAVVVVAVLAACGTGAAIWYASSTTNSLVAAQSDGLTLQKRIAGFNDLKATKADLKARSAAQMVGGAGDVDWATYLRGIQTTLPEGVAVTDVSMKMVGAEGESSSTAAPGQSETEPSIATLTFTATTSTVPSIPDWIGRLGSLPGFLTAEPGALTYDDGAATYSSTVTMDIGTGALSYKYVPKPKGASK